MLQKNPSGIITFGAAGITCSDTAGSIMQGMQPPNIL